MSKVLVVDDDPAARETYAVVLAAAGHDVLEVPDAPSALAEVAENRPDLVLLDWRMPLVDGLDLLRTLKGSPGTRDIPVVMLTALDGVSEIHLATSGGADGYLCKPFDVQDLLSIVSRFTGTPETGP